MPMFCVLLLWGIALLGSMIPDELLCSSIVWFFELVGELPDVGVADAVDGSSSMRGEDTDIESDGLN